jgi:hypothetical protein
MVGGGVVNVGGDPDDVVDSVPFDEAEQPGNLELPSARRSVVTVGNGLEASSGITNNQPQRHVAGDHLPGRS